MDNKTSQWGWHLIIDANNGNEAIKSIDIVKQFVITLIQKIDMVPYKDIMIERFATHDPLKGGISFCQMIETSNITGHFVDLNHNFFIDIFSCKKFNENDVIELVNEYFNPKSLEFKFISRG